jgi:SAM-dependent methyltransferase
MLAGHPRARILDIGCSGGLLADRLRADGHFVVGVDREEVVGVRKRTDKFFVADLGDGIPVEVGAGYDIIIAGDVVEHLPRPRDTLREMALRLRPGGEVLLSVPNFGHWYPRLRVSLGLFGYDRLGILDETHLRFFTRSTLRRLVRSAGFDILEETSTGLPLGSVTDPGPVRAVVGAFDRSLVRLRPTLFGYQHVLRLTPHAEETVHLVDMGEAERGSAVPSGAAMVEARRS